MDDHKFVIVDKIKYYIIRMAWVVETLDHNYHKKYGLRGHRQNISESRIHDDDGDYDDDDVFFFILIISF